MRYRLLGGSGLRVSELFLGAMTFSDDFVHGADRAEARRILDTYAAAGGNVIDTAVNYRDGASEQIVGELVQGRRDEFVLATKYTVSRNGSDPNASGNSRKNLRLSLETSLRRLRTDHVDLYYVHIWDPHTPIEETMRALDDAVRGGKVLYVGISDAPAWVVARAHSLAQWRDWTASAAVQLPYNLLQRDAERELLPAAEALGLSVAAWGPLAGGGLSGKFTTSTTAGTGPTRIAAGSLGDRERVVAAAVDAVAHDLGVSSSQVAIAWTRAHSRSVHPIVGARTQAQLQQNLGALDIVLPPELRDRLDAVSRFEVGFPTDFIASTREFVYGPVGSRVDPR